MRLIRAKSYRRMPWKNGGGETIEMAIHPAGADVGSFDWRVSMARVEADGPFSIFSGIDRTLTILDGDGLELTLDGEPPVQIVDQPHSFPGDVAASVRLIGGPVSDLNVMTRRGRYIHRVSLLAVSGTRDFVVRSPTALLYCHRGEVAVEDEYAAPFQVMQGDALFIEAQPNSLRLSAAAQSELVLVEIGPA